MNVQQQQQDDGGQQRQPTAGIPGKDDERKLFVGGLSRNTTDKELRDYFGKYGDIESISVKMDQYTGLSRGFAFMVFTNPKAIDKLLASGEHYINKRKVSFFLSLSYFLSSYIETFSHSGCWCARVCESVYNRPILLHDPRRFCVKPLSFYGHRRAHSHTLAMYLPLVRDADAGWLFACFCVRA